MRIAYVCADQGVPVCGRKGCSVHVLRRRLGEAARATVLGQHAWAAVADCILRLAEAAPAPGLVARGREVP